MWLDGVYMLPFILLQVYNVVRGKKNWGLSVCVGLAIVFNWYSAGIDCIFSGFWFLFELGLFVLKKAWKKRSFPRYLPVLSIVMRKINSVTYEVGSVKAEQAQGMFGLTAD